MKSSIGFAEDFSLWSIYNQDYFSRHAHFIVKKTLFSCLKFEFKNRIYLKKRKYLSTQSTPLVILLLRLPVKRKSIRIISKYNSFSSTICRLDRW